MIKISKKRKYDSFTTTYTNTNEMVENIYSSLFNWNGLEELNLMTSEDLELMLLEHHVVGAFKTNVGLQIFPVHFTMINQFGVPCNPQPIIVGGYPIEIDPSVKPIILFDQPNHTSIKKRIKWYVNALSDLRKAITQTTNWLKNPMIFMSGSEERDSVQTLISKIEQGQTVFGVFKDSIDIDGIKILPTNVTPQILQALHQSHANIKYMLFEELGIPTGDNQKQAQQTKDEILLPLVSTSIISLKRLDMRRKFVDNVNSVYGTNISVDSLTIGLIEQSIFNSAGRVYNINDKNANGINDREEV